MSVQVSKSAKAAKDRNEPTIKVKLKDDVILPDPDVKYGAETFVAGDTVEVVEAHGERFIRVGCAEKA